AAGPMLTETSNVVNASVNRGTNAKAAAGGTSATVGDVISQLVIVNKSSFAAVMGTQPVHKVVNLSKLRNEEIVKRVAVALPLAVVEEVNASENCPKKPKEIITSDVSAKDVVKKDTADDGFKVVKKKRNKKKKHQKQVDGVVLNKPSLTLHYR
nr:hypothetical protein [Tanacetum cinerariifolium]